MAEEVLQSPGFIPLHVASDRGAPSRYKYAEGRQYMLSFFNVVGLL
jgi:hypothetical protein